MKIKDLRQMIKESINEMARIATGLKLTDNWEEAWGKAPANIRNGVRHIRLINYLKKHGTGVLKDIALDAGSYDTASISPLARELEALGVIEKTGLVSEPKSKVPILAPGEKGRPKQYDDQTRFLGIAVAGKFAKKDFNYEPKEIQYIKDLYNSIKGLDEGTEVAPLKPKIKPGVNPGIRPSPLRPVDPSKMPRPKNESFDKKIVSRYQKMK